MLKLRLWMSMPSPASAPTNSATMAPTSENTIATSSPAMMNESAEGSRSIQKICSCVAPSERIRSTRSSSAERSPTTVFTSRGKNAIRAALTTLDVSPRPNQTTTRGARATLGMDWNMTMYGYRKYSVSGLAARAIPNTKATVDPRANPSSVSASVTKKCCR